MTILIINFVFFFPESLFSSKDQRRDYEHIIIFKKIYNFRNTCIHILNYYLKLHDYYDDDYYYYYYYNDDDDDDEDDDENTDDTNEIEFNRKLEKSFYDDLHLNFNTKTTKKSINI